MNVLSRRSSKAVALALAAVLQVYASGGFALAAPEPDSASVGASAQEAQGRLTTAGDRPVAVNGNNAATGETIFSGQRIQTPAGTGATVQLGALGSLEIRPGADVTLTFGGGRVVVVVARGCVRLTTPRGVTGELQSGGKTSSTGADGGTIDNCDDAALPVAAATAGGLGDLTATALTAAIVGGFALIAHEIISDSSNPQPAPCTPIPGTTSPLTPPSGCTP